MNTNRVAYWFQQEPLPKRGLSFEEMGMDGRISHLAKSG